MEFLLIKIYSNLIFLLIFDLIMNFIIILLVNYFNFIYFLFVLIIQYKVLLFLINLLTLKIHINIIYFIVIFVYNFALKFIYSYFQHLYHINFINNCYLHLNYYKFY